MNRATRNPLVLLVVFAGLLVPFAPVRAQTTSPADGPATRPAPVTVTIFHTADIHEHTGTLARIAGYVKAARAKDPNVLLVDAGDMVGGGGEKAMAATHGEAMAAMLSAAGYDACVLGNWDYTLGGQRILELARKYPAWPLLACNIRWGPEDQDAAGRIPAHKIVRLNGVAVALVGSASHDMRYAKGKRLAVVPQTPAILQQIPALRKQTDLVVALTHQYEQDDYTLARHAAGPDLVIGGHSHGAYFGWGKGPSRGWIAKPGPYARKLGVVKITLEAGLVVERQGQLLDVSNDWPEDPVVKALREKFGGGREEGPASRPARAASRPAASP